MTSLILPAEYHLMAMLHTFVSLLRTTHMFGIFVFKANVLLSFKASNVTPHIRIMRRDQPRQTNVDFFKAK